MDAGGQDEIDTHDSGQERRLPPGWPALSLAQADARLTAPGALFEMQTVKVNGRPVRSWRNQSATLPDLVRKARDQFGPNEFVIFENDRMRYEGFYRATSALAHALVDAGIKQGDRVAFAMRNLPEWPVTMAGIAAAGAIAVPLNAWWSGAELAHGLNDSGARMLIADYPRAEAVRPLRDSLENLEAVWVTRRRGRDLAEGEAEFETVIGPVSGYEQLPDRPFPDIAIVPEDPVTIFYTSGTTGKPKGALGTHRNMMTAPLSNAYAMHRSALRRGDPPPPSRPRITLLVIPMFHVTACNSSLMTALVSGSTIVLMRKWDPVRAMALIEREKITQTGGVPTIAWQLLDHPDRAKYDLSSLDTMLYGGAPAAPELARRLSDELGLAAGCGWGMTETSSTVTYFAGEDYTNRPDSCGPPVPVSDIKIMSTDGTHEMPVGEVGELWAYGPQVVSGYWNNEEATARSFVDGWVKTGDLAKVDTEGFCFIIDRAKDMVIRGGENIYSIEIENVLFDHPAVIDAAVVGLPHRTLGEEPAAVVQLSAEATASEDELRLWVAERLAAFKVPVKIGFCKEPLPRNANGKVLKPEIRRMLEEKTG